MLRLSIRDMNESFYYEKPLDSIKKEGKYAHGSIDSIRWEISLNIIIEEKMEMCWQCGMSVSMA